MSIKEAAEYLGVSTSHVHKLIERGELTRIRDPLYRKGGPVKIPREDIERAQLKRQREITGG